MNQSFDTSEKEAVNHWRWTENKTCTINSENKRRNKTRRQFDGCKTTRISKIK